MFALFRFGLLPVVLYCLVVIAAGIDVGWTTAVRKSTWPQTVLAVVEGQDRNQLAAAFRGAANTFPDPYGVARYTVDGQTYTWQGRGRDIGLTALNPGDRIPVYYNPKDPREIGTLVLLGASTGTGIMAAASAFLAAYLWFFWLRGLLRRSGPGGSGDGRRGRRASRHAASEAGTEDGWSRTAIESYFAQINEHGPAAPPLRRDTRVTFGKRST